MATEPAPVAVRPVYDFEAANQQKIDAGQQLAPLAEALDDIEVRIAELFAISTDVEFD